MKQHTVRGQRWRDLPVPELGEWQPTQRLCVVIPARDCQPTLDRTLASLSRQTYPADKTEVVIVDDASHTPLRIPTVAPEQVRILRVDEAQEHGSGRARDRGARSTDAEIVLFLDADMVVSATHLESHARWHHLSSHAVVLGRKRFVDFTDVTPDDVAQAVADNALPELLQGRPSKRHGWQEVFVQERARLTKDVADTFVAVVGADVSVRRDFYLRVGGFAHLGLRGIVDTEFGYRAFTSGGLIIPDWGTRAFHQGARSFAAQGAEIKRERSGLAANLLPIPLFRPQNVGRRWSVPSVHVIVETAGADPEDVQVTTDSVLASEFTDLTVSLVGAIPQWVQDYFGADGRVQVVAEAPASGYPAPVTAHLSAGVMLGRESVCRALEQIRTGGGVRTEVAAGRHFTVQTTRSVLRHADSPDEDALKGPSVVAAEDLGVGPVRYHVTAQGMIVGGAVEETTEPDNSAPTSVGERPAAKQSSRSRLLRRFKRPAASR